MGVFTLKKVVVTPIASKARFELIVADSILQILKCMGGEFGLDYRGPNFAMTPERVARSYSEIFVGLMDNGEQVKKILAATFPATSEEMVTVGPIDTWSVCAHHLLPVHMHVWVSYIPRKKVLGLSKMARLAELVAKKPGLQEEATNEIAQTLYNVLKPKGAACLIRGRHLCMEMRGVKKSSITTTTALAGNFLRQGVKNEFLASVRADISGGTNL